MPLLSDVFLFTQNFVQSYYSGSHLIKIQKALEELLESSFFITPLQNVTHNLTFEEFLTELSNLSEDTSSRKLKGVFYTNNDITNFIVKNVLANYFDNDIDILIKHEDVDKRELLKLVNLTCFDPTCGSAQFLIAYTQFVLNRYKNISDDLVVKMSKNIFGNDICAESVLISKLRLFFLLINKVSNTNRYIEIAQNLKKNFFCFDFVISPPIQIKKKFDIIIGNPPYVESRCLPVQPVKKFGNTYANVLDNIEPFSKNNTVISFVLPISFISTPRMKKIRSLIFEKYKKCFLINFSDRPDSLFRDAHQKLTIIIGTKRSIKSSGIYSSTYNYWYKNERSNLFNQLNLYKLTNYFDTFIPKIGTSIEQNIFNKLVFTNDCSLLDKLNSKNNDSLPLYLNQRATFWIKAFSFNPGSKEYKLYRINNDEYSYVYCLLNSSLFFMFWIIVSDCWHITNKELSLIKLPKISNENQKKFTNLYIELEQKLEKTKEHIGSKQVQFEYKHKKCKEVIDKIDKLLANIYHLTNEEHNFVISYKDKYRLNNEK